MTVQDLIIHRGHLIKISVDDAPIREEETEARDKRYRKKGLFYGYELFSLGIEGSITQQEPLDSCWGFFGRDWDKNGLMFYVNDFIDQMKKEEVLNDQERF